MPSITSFFQFIEQPAIEVSYYKGDPEAGIETLTVNEYFDEDELGSYLRGLYSKAIREVTTMVQQSKSEADVVTFMIEVISRIEKIQALYSEKNIEEKDGDETFTIETTICSNAHWCHAGEYSRGNSNSTDLIYANNFLKILKEYAIDFHKHVLTLEKRLPSIIGLLRAKNASKAERPKFYWHGGKTDLAELLWCLVESDSIFKDGTKQNRIEHSELARVVGDLFSIDLKDHNKLMDSAFKRKNKYGSPFLVRLNEIFLERVKFKSK